MAMILDAFVGKCVERLLSLIEEKAIMMLGVKEDLRRMQRLMKRLQRILEDAERKRMKILSNTAWSMTKFPEEISGALYLSYADLPSPLKQCFLYCSLFPEDSSIAHVDIVRLWVAEGFIKEEGDSSMEDTAEEYFYELTMRSLLVPYTLSTLKSNILRLDAYECKMHDLFRALAPFISRDESFSGNVIEKSAMPSTKLRRVALTGEGNAEGFLGAMTELKCLQTLFNFRKPTLDFRLLVTFRHLRVLNLSDNEIEYIPDSIEDLVHLRYLNLNRTLMRQLPESIGRLSNLQYLDLRQCKYLTMRLERISNLPVLKYLTVRECCALQNVEGLDGLEELNLYQESMDCLPEWLLMLIEERVRRKEGQDDEDDFLLQLYCSEGVLRRCLKGGAYWAFIQQIPRVNAYTNKGEEYMGFVKQPFFHETYI